MRIYKTIKDLAPGTEYAIQFSSTNGENDSEWSQVQNFTTTSDVIAPAPVTNLAWYNSGDAFTSQWDKVTLNSDGTPLKDFRYYRVTVSDGTKARDYFVVGEKFEFTLAENLDLFGSIKTTIQITVRAVDLTYNESSPVSVTASPSNPPTPSKPIIRKTVGLLNVEWDGLTSAGVAMPANLAYIEVHASTTSNFTPTDATNLTAVTSAGRRAVIDNLTYGTTYYVRFVAVNTIKKKSAASVQETGTPTRISGLDIENGQIGVAQINFTAFDIGGANAYYQTSQPANGMKNGDLWYDTDDGYTVYRYNGTTWVAAPEVGQISGTKILAGTVTANAIGTNQIIASSANIATAAIDSANIASLKVDKITSGTMNAEVVVSGRFASALTGARTEMNSQGFFKFDSSGNQLVAIDGTQALLTGVYKTALTGRRIVMSSGGTSGEQVFWTPGDTRTSKIRSFTQIDGTTEALRIDGPTLTGQTVESFINLNSSNYTSYAAYIHEFQTYGPATGRQFKIYDGDFLRLMMANNQTTFYQGGAGFYITDTNGTTFSIVGRSFNLNINNGGRFFAGSNGQFYIDPGNSRGFLDINANGGGNSPFMKFVTPANYGVTLKSYYDSRGVALEVRNVNDDNFEKIRASAFEVNSDRRDKTSIKKINSKETSFMLQEIVSHDLYRYKRNNVAALDADKNTPGPEEIGLIAQEAPEQIVNGNEETRFGIDSYQMSAMLWGAVQELNKKIERLEAANENK